MGFGCSQGRAPVERGEHNRTSIQRLAVAVVARSHTRPIRTSRRLGQTLQRACLWLSRSPSTRKHGKAINYSSSILSLSLSPRWPVGGRTQFGHRMLSPLASSATAFSISAPSSRTSSSSICNASRGSICFSGGEKTTTKKKKNRSCISWTMSAAIPADMTADSGSALSSKLAPLEAVLFDIDGTLVDSDPIHFCAFRDLLQQVGFHDGVPITEEFYSATISGGHNDDLARALFPDMGHEKAMQFMDDKEALFRKLAPGQLKPVDGLQDLCKWIEGRNLKRAAVTNAPRANAELMLSLLGLTDFFPVLIIGSECDRAKPFPDPYLKALELINASPDHTIIFEDSASGIRAGVAAGVPVVGLTTRNPEKALNDAGASLLIKDFQDPKLLSMLEEIDSTAVEAKGR